MPTTLARIEGAVGGVRQDIAHVLERVNDHGNEIIQHREQIGVIQSNVQQIRSDQDSAAKDLVSADAARETTAAALEKQTEALVAKAKAAVDQSTQKWSPAMRFFGGIVAFAAIGGFIVSLLAFVYGP